MKNDAPARKTAKSNRHSRSPVRRTGHDGAAVPSRRSTLIWLAGVLVIVVAGVAIGSWRAHQRATPAPSVLERPGEHVLGPADAPVTIVEFGDFQCPACGAEEPVIQKLLKNYATQVRFVFREFPLSIHENAELAAEAAEAAGAQGKFWEMHDMLYKNQEHLTLADVLGYATAIGLDVNTFQADLASHKYQPVVQKDIADGQALQVQGTPTFFINGRQYMGALPYDQLAAAVDQALRAAGGK